LKEKHLINKERTVLYFIALLHILLRVVSLDIYCVSLVLFVQRTLGYIPPSGFREYQ